MGKAERRKGVTRDERIKNAIEAQEREVARIKEAVALQAMEEFQGWKTMVWWQLELTIERIEYFKKRRMKTAMLSSLLAGTIYSTFGGMYDRRR